MDPVEDIYIFLGRLLYTQDTTLETVKMKFYLHFTSILHVVGRISVFLKLQHRSVKHFKRHGR